MICLWQLSKDAMNFFDFAFASGALRMLLRSLLMRFRASGANSHLKAFTEFEESVANNEDNKKRDVN